MRPIGIKYAKHSSFTEKWFRAARLFVMCLVFSSSVVAATGKPNILIIWGDDIGIFNISAYNDGVLGYRTRILTVSPKKACDSLIIMAIKAVRPAGRRSSPARRVCVPASPRWGCPVLNLGLQDRDVTIAQLLKDKGYATGQFGKNHLGDKDEYLPTNHGFDEFFGNLYHLNAEEEPEDPDYPKAPGLSREFRATRGYPLLC